MGRLKLDAKLWQKIHKKAMECKNDSSKKQFNKYIKKLYSKIECPECKGHMKKFMKRERIKDHYNMYSDMGEHNGMFVWTWKLHNDVNARTGKRIIPYEEAYNMYKSSDYRPCCSY